MPRLGAVLRALYWGDTGRAHGYRSAPPAFDVATIAFVIVAASAPSLDRRALGELMDAASGRGHDIPWRDGPRG